LRAVLLVAVLSTACSHDPTANSFVQLRDRFFVRHLLFNPVTSTYLGADGYSDVLHATNGALKDYSEATLSRELAFYRETQKELGAISASGLSPSLQVDYHVMDAQLKYLIRLIGDRRYQQRALDTYVTEPFRGIDWQIQQMQDFGANLRGTEDEWMLVATRLDAVPRYLDAARANIAAGKQAGNAPDWRMIQRDGMNGSTGNVEYFRHTLPESAAGYIGSRPFAGSVIPKIREASEKTAAAYEAFAAFLRSTFEAGLKPYPDRFAAGTDEYEWRVHNVLRDPRSAAELYEYGAQQVALYSSRLREIAAVIARDAGLGNASLRVVVNHLTKDSPTSDDELFAWYREAAARALDYGRRQAMFDIPSDYKLDIVATPPVLRGSIEAAYYPAPPFKKSGVGRFYLSPTGNDAVALKLKNRASVADTAIHEGFPGHDWHFKFMTQHAGEISNVRWLTPGAVEDSSSMWSDSMAAEGWGLYAEELMAEPGSGRPYGFYSAPEYFYQLQGQMMRAVRVRVDVGIHTGRMTFDQARDYYVEHVEFFPGACTSTEADARAACAAADMAIYRYSKWPTQAITYNLGKNAIISLREEYKKKTGTAYSPRSFHEKLMRMGTVPVTYFREMFLMHR
jgi:uncharacterized protein (DUF885 family)